MKRHSTRSKKAGIESAVKLLEDAITLAPNFFHAHNNLGILYQVVEAISAMRSGNSSAVTN